MLYVSSGTLRWAARRGVFFSRTCQNAPTESSQGWAGCAAIGCKAEGWVFAGYGSHFVPLCSPVSVVRAGPAGSAWFQGEEPKLQCQHLTQAGVQRSLSPATLRQLCRSWRKTWVGKTSALPLVICNFSVSMKCLARRNPGNSSCSQRALPCRQHLPVLRCHWLVKLPATPRPWGSFQTMCDHLGPKTRTSELGTI